MTCANCFETLDKHIDLDNPHRMATAYTPPERALCPNRTTTYISEPRHVSLRRGQYVTMTVRVKLDGTGYGTFSTPESAEQVIQKMLLGAIPWYDPQVKLLNGKTGMTCIHRWKLTADEIYECEHCLIATTQPILHGIGEYV
jgi:hypothetical protein